MKTNEILRGILQMDADYQILKEEKDKIGGYYVESCQQVRQLNVNFEAALEDFKEIIRISESDTMEESHIRKDIYNIALKYFKKAEK